MPRVLIIEEQEKLRRLLVNIFKQEGFGICEGIIGKRANELLEKNPYDLIIVGLSGKPAEGCEIVRSIKVSGSLAEVVVIVPKSGYDMDQVVRCGIYDYLIKPFLQKDLIEIGKKALEKKTTG